VRPCPVVSCFAGPSRTHSVRGRLTTADFFSNPGEAAARSSRPSPSENALRVRTPARIFGIRRNRLGARGDVKLRPHELQNLLLASPITINGNTFAFQAVSQTKSLSHVVQPDSLRMIGGLGNRIVAPLLKRRSS